MMWLIVSSLSPHNLHLQFCCFLSIQALIWLVHMALFSFGESFTWACRVTAVYGLCWCVVSVKSLCGRIQFILVSKVLIWLSSSSWRQKIRVKSWCSVCSCVAMYREMVESRTCWAVEGGWSMSQLSRWLTEVVVDVNQEESMIVGAGWSACELVLCSVCLWRLAGCCVIVLVVPAQNP